MSGGAAGTGAGWRHELHRWLLLGYGRLPEPVRLRIVRLAAPSYTVGALGLVERPDGHVLLVRQVYRPRWGLPGGLIQRREEPAAAVRREIREEVNLDVQVVGDPSMVVEAVPRLIDIVFHARPVSLEAVAEMRPTSAEIVEARWFPPDQLPELQRETAAALAALATSGSVSFRPSR